MKNKTQLVYSDLKEIEEIALKAIEFAEEKRIWLFEGDLGAGKTTLIRTICRLKGVKENVTSPTFSLINEYHSSGGDVFYHFDFYRIKEESEALDMGYEEYFYSGNYCFIEWPSKIPSLIPDSYLHIEIIQTDQGNKRTVNLSLYDEKQAKNRS